MTPDQIQRRIEQLEASVAELQAQARNADGVIALLLGIVAGTTGVAFELDREELPGIPSPWLDLIFERFEMGQNMEES